MKAKFLFAFFVSVMAASCYYDTEEELYNCAADAASVKYATTVSNILTSYGCTGCHSGSAPSGGYNFTTYAGVKASVDAGRLYGSINHSPGFSPMPQGGGKMSACDVKKVKAWIDAGAPNN